MNVFFEKRGTSPLIVSMPHSGTHLPDGMAERMTDAARGLPDTDWHVPELYDFLDELGASTIRATHSRYVIDLNRDPTGASLYPGQATTELVPTTLFDGSPVYRPGEEPDEAEIEQRRTDYYDPYHRALTEMIVKVRMEHGYVVLWDAHSILDEVPRLFEGVLPDLNLGTNGGESCDRTIERWAVKAMMDHEDYASIVNGRFKGGYITRHYGRPQDGVHALQLEIAQACYMDEQPPWPWDARRAQPLQQVLRRLVDVLLRWTP